MREHKLQTFFMVLADPAVDDLGVEVPAFLVLDDEGDESQPNASNSDVELAVLPVRGIRSKRPGAVPVALRARRRNVRLRPDRRRSRAGLVQDRPRRPRRSRRHPPA